MDKKGFLFTYDIALAFMIFIIILLSATFYASNASENRLTSVHLAGIGSDVINVLIRDGTMNTLNTTKIDNKIAKLIPGRYDMFIRITANDGFVAELNKTIPKDIFIGSGRFYFVTNDNAIAKAEYRIWQKA